MKSFLLMILGFLSFQLLAQNEQVNPKFLKNGIDILTKKQLSGYNERASKRLQTRGNTTNDTFFISYNAYSGNWAGTKTGVIFNETFTSGSSTFPRSVFMTNNVIPANDGRTNEVYLVYDSIAWNAVSNNTYFSRYFRKDSVQLKIDSFFLINTAMFTDTTLLDGDSVVISFHPINGKVVDTLVTLQRTAYKDKAGLMPFYNDGRYYTHRMPCGFTLPRGAGFGVRVKYYANEVNDSSLFSLAYGYLDSCRTIVVNGSTFRSFAHAPLFFANNYHREIDSTSPTAATTSASGNNFRYTITGVPTNCSYVDVQAIDAGFIATINSTFTGLLTFQPEKNTAYCPGEKVIISPNGSGGMPFKDPSRSDYNYKWTATSGTIDNDTDPQIELTLGNTNVTVTVTIKDSLGDSVRITRTVPVSNLNPTITASKPSLGGCKDSLNLSATSIVGATYAWSAPGATGNILKVKTPGTYTVTVTNTAGCSVTVTNTVTGNFSTLPTLDFTFTPSGAATAANVICQNKTDVTFNVSAAATRANWNYSWADQSGALSTPTGTSVVHQFTASGVRTVTLSADSSGCVATPVSKSVTVTSSTNALCKPVVSIATAAKDAIKIYPNPVQNGSLHIENNTNTAIRIRVSDILGKTIYTSSGSKNQTINMEQNPNGIYFVEIEAKGERTIQKVIVDKQ